MAATLFLINLASTWFLCGLIWFVQIVHYPAFCQVGTAGFADYHAHHTRTTTWVVVVPMLLELLSAAALVGVTRPTWMSATVAWIGLAAVGVIWLLTFALQVPQHKRLARGFDAGQHRYLCRSNWLRTAIWTFRALLLTATVAAALR